jgi:energy-coupling factor transporter ATP-binding protein EcfA2
MLSGGNQQKIVLARALYREPTVLLPHDGTRGVDVGTKADIFALVAGLAAKGTSVVFCSSDLSALAHFCDRVYVMAEGRVRGRLDAAGGELSEESILRLALTPGADDGRARPRARPVRGRHPRRRDGGHRLRAGRRTRLDRPRPGRRDRPRPAQRPPGGPGRDAAVHRDPGGLDDLQRHRADSLLPLFNLEPASLSIAYGVVILVGVRVTTTRGTGRGRGRRAHRAEKSAAAG